MTYQYRVKGVDYEVEIEDIDGNIANVTVNGIPFEVEMKKPISPAGHIHKPIAKTEATAAPEPKTVTEPVKPQVTEKASSSAASGSVRITAPLPGTINDIKVKVGDKVNAGDTVVILEAMKMANSIQAESNGIVASINVAKGDNVMEGDVLVTLS